MWNPLVYVSQYIYIGICFFNITIINIPIVIIDISPKSIIDRAQLILQS